MSNQFAIQAARYSNEINRSLGALVGIAQGLISDQQLSDQEIAFLNDWLTANDAISSAWPGDVILARVRTTMQDGVITDSERAHLVTTLQQLVGGTLETLASTTHVTELALDTLAAVRIPASTFCFTGDFVYGPRERCSAAVQARGGVVLNSVTKKLSYLVVGGLGSEEWKHGSFGTKIEKALHYKRKGVPLFIVHEELWSKALEEHAEA